MPSLTDLQQQTTKMSINNNGKSTPPPTQQQQTSSISTGLTTDASSADPITQAILMLEKKQRNLGKRKEKLESYQQEEKSGKELHKDQKEALAKYGEVLGQIECVKDVYEQMKKIQIDCSKNQKRLLKQAAEEKRVLVAQRLREYAQLRYLLEHRPTSLKAEESSLLDELARLVVPSDVSSNTVTRSIDTVLSIYQGGSSTTTTIKNLTGRTSQEIRETLEQLFEQAQTSSSSSSSSALVSSSSSSLPTTNETGTPQQSQTSETVKQTPLVPQVPPTTPASLLPQRDQNQKQLNNNDDVLGPSLSHTQLVQTNLNEYPLQFDTRNQNIPLQQIIQDSPFFSHDLTTINSNQQVKQDSTNNQDNTHSQSNDPNQFLPTFTVLNSTLNNQVPSHGYSQVSSTSAQQQQGVNDYDQESSSHLVNANTLPTDEQQSEEQWQHTRSNSGNAQRTGQYNGAQNRSYNRGGPNNYSQQNWRGARGGQYENSYGSGQRQYNDNTNRGGTGQRGGSNPNYRGNRGGNYRGGNRGAAAGYNGNGYQKSSQYEQQQHN